MNTSLSGHTKAASHPPPLHQVPISSLDHASFYKLRGKPANKGPYQVGEMRLRLQEAADDLARWRSVAGFRRILSRYSERHDDFGLDQPGSAYRDAATALMFAEALRAELVRLGADPPDFELMDQGVTLACEAVELLRPGRRRGDELNRDRRLTLAERRTPQHLGDDAWADTGQVLEHLRATVTRKAAKAYAAGTILCIYANPGFLTDRAAFSRGLAAAVTDGFPTFAAVWLLHGETLQRFAP